QANRPCCSAWFATRTNLRCNELGRTSDEEVPASVRCDSLGGSLQRTSSAVEEAPAIVRCDSLGGSLQRTGLD
ncbi:hypothetical protein A2U01_0034485, partial [Trifolium medium]|nr:hypothetical protein [Trifolium medium]